MTERKGKKGSLLKGKAFFQLKDMLKKFTVIMYA